MKIIYKYLKICYYYIQSHKYIKDFCNSVKFQGTYIFFSYFCLLITFENIYMKMFCSMYIAKTSKLYI